MMTTTLITIFALSFFGIASMLGRKVYALHGVHHLESSSTHHFYRDLSFRAFGWYKTTQKILRYLVLRANEKLLKVVASVLRAFIQTLMFVNARVQNKLSSVTSLVRGKPSIELTPDKASGYLKDIARHKDEVRSGNHGGE